MNNFTRHEFLPVDTIVKICGGHRWAGHLGIIARYERPRDMPKGPEFAVVLLIDREKPREVCVLRPRQMRRVKA